MKCNWKECTLGDLITFQRGHDLPKSQMINGKYPVVGSNGIIGYHNEYTTEAPSITIGRSGNVGNPYIVYGRTWSHNTTLYVKDFKGNDPVFVYYFLKTIDLANYAGGSAVPTLNRNHIHTLPIEVPESVGVQKKIGYYLRLFDEKIELNNEINKNLEQQAKILFKSWFVDFEPFDEPLIETPAGIYAPASLQMVQIANIPHVLETGKRPKGGAVASGVPSIGAENVKQLGVVNFSSAKFIPEEFAAKMKTGAINGYELLLYKDGGKPGTFIPHFSMFGEGFPYQKFFINEHVFKLDFGDKGFNEFAYFFLQTDYAYHWLASNGGKAAVPGINQQNVKDIWIFSPENSKVKEFGEWVQPLFTTILKNCTQNVKLAELRDTLLPKLMSGELDVSDIEI